MRPAEHHLFYDNAALTVIDPVIPPNTYVIDIDTGVSKLGDGESKWSELPSLTSMMIGSKALQSNRLPLNNELVMFCSAEDKWIFRLAGCFITETECLTLSTVYDKFTMIVETDDVSGIPTGRFKMGDGTNGFDDLPWFGQDLSKDDYDAGQAPVFNGTDFAPVTVMTNDILQAAATPLGKFHRDDGTWAFFEECSFELGEFGSVVIGEGSTEATTVSLTTVNGTDLLVDGYKVWTQNNDGVDSGLDADLLDGHQASYFSAWDHTHPLDPFVEGDIIVSDGDGLASNSGTSLADIDEDALVYAIAMGG